MDKMVDLPFSNNLPDGVEAKSSLKINMNILFTDVVDTFFTEGEVPLQMQSIGNFKLNPGGKEEWEPPLTNQITGKPEVIVPMINTKFWSNGYEQDMTNGDGQNKKGGFGSVVNSYFPELMWTTRANQTSRKEDYYVEEGNHRVIARIDPTPTYSQFYPAGFSESLLYKNWAISSLNALYNESSQSKYKTGWFSVDSISTWFGENKTTNDPRDKPGLGFDLSMLNANYNWEVFYHIPIAAAMFLSRQHRFEDARKWFHLVFDPTTNDPANDSARFWRFLPFRDAQAPETITELLEALAKPSSTDIKIDVQDQIKAWLGDPFNPFAVARLRTSAFEWYTVNSYIKNLFDWADQLFRRDTRESINEATLLYVMGAQILGPRPEKIRSRNTISQNPLSYRALNSLNNGSSDYDFSNTWLSLADNPLVKAWAAWLALLAQQGTVNSSFTNPSWYSDLERLASIGSLYFCVPANEKIAELWDLVDDRLFKIRHCENIEGVTRTIPLYEAPIDPELLIRAKAAGLDLQDVLSDRSAPPPNYRFQILLQKANEFCNEVRNLGNSILSAVEKRESEHLSLLRSGQEITMLKLVQSVKEDQIREAQANIDALQKTRDNSLNRFAYLQQQLGINTINLDSGGVPKVEQSLMLQVQETGTPDGFSSLALITSEIDQIRNMDLANLFSIISGVNRFGAGVAHLIGLNPVAKDFADATGFALSAVGDGFGSLAAQMSFLERRSSQMALWQRRRDEWVQQSKMTAEEIRQFDKQILSLEIRKSIAEKELENHINQIEHSKNIDDYMRALKFSGEMLYGWMESELSGLFFSAYQMAYELSKKAERAYQHELGEPSSSFIQYGHWDNLRKGLLSGERLSQDLRRMESAYLDRNRRELEITKHISLRQMNPLALLQLKGASTSSCEFNLPEALFDMDFPGHYKRRIKSASISIPCIAGPYTSINANLSLVNNRFRNSAIANNYPEQTDKTDDRFVTYNIPITAIATSSGQNDSGMFELNFKDERYLPFEGAGVISQWKLEFPGIKQFNYDSISDVILHIRYTASEGGEILRGAARESVRSFIKSAQNVSETEGLSTFISLKHDMPNEWNLLAKFAKAKIKIDANKFPYFAQNNLSIDKISFLVLAKDKSGLNISISLIDNPDSPQPNAAVSLLLNKLDAFDGLYINDKEGSYFKINTFFEIDLVTAFDKIEDLMMIVKYKF
jgi:hypothetical protein